MPGGRLVAVAGRQVEIPVGAAVGQAQEVGARLGQLDLWNADGLPEQRQRREAEFDAFQAGELARLGLARRPLRVAEGDVLGAEARPGDPGAPAFLALLAAPGHGEVAVDGERAVQRRRDLFVEGGLDQVPVEGGDEHHQRRQQQDQAGEAPGQDLSAARHAQLLFAASVVGQARQRASLSPSVCRLAHGLASANTPARSVRTGETPALLPVPRISGKRPVRRRVDKTFSTARDSHLR
ncbi:Uncharacterised protein [Klebsiella pneumoniae]|nr:Uncharacterised protein [Klebsiella pneumoniae]